MKKKHSRARELVACLKKNGVVTIADLSKKFDVSHMTIRRDLETLAGNNLVKLINGVAVYAPGNIAEHALSPYYLSRAESVMAKEKIRICKKAASLIEANDTVIIDAGSTTAYLPQFIPDNLPLTILCYTTNVLLKLQNRENCKLIFAGGYFHNNTRMFESPEGVGLIRQHRAHKAFISASAISAVLGVMCSNPYEIETKKAVMQSSLVKILLADSSKFDKIQSSYFADLKDFNIIITDKRMPVTYRQLIRENNSTLYTV
ncbi:MAG: DeoR/GlpR family DNA-binding transcription regulator [Spirochaetota bacterium]